MLGVVLLVYSIVLLNYDPRSPWINPVRRISHTGHSCIHWACSCREVTCIISGVNLIRRERIAGIIFLSIGLGIVLGAGLPIFMLPARGAGLLKKVAIFVLGGFEVVSLYAALVVISYPDYFMAQQASSPHIELDYIVIWGGRA